MYWMCLSSWLFYRAYQCTDYDRDHILLLFYVVTFVNCVFQKYISDVQLHVLLLWCCYKNAFRWYCVVVENRSWNTFLCCEWKSVTLNSQHIRSGSDYTMFTHAHTSHNLSADSDTRIPLTPKGQVCYFSPQWWQWMELSVNFNFKCSICTLKV